MGVYEDRFNNPLPYIFSTYILALLSYEIYNKNRPLAVFYAVVCFFIVLYFIGRYVAIILSIFFVVFTLNIIGFYNYVPDGYEEVRIVYEGNYYGKGEVEGRIVNLTNLNSSIKVGDRIIVKGKFESDRNIVKGIIGDYNIEDYIVLEEDFIRKLYRRREYIFEQINKKLDSRKSALITSVAFGYKNELDLDHKELMKSLGISHALSISGLHLALVYGIMMKIFGVKISLVLALVYTLFTGASPPSVRAYIMIFIISIAKVVKRDYSPVAGLSLAGVVILLAKPYEIFNLGFILSFLATLGIILFNKKLNKVFYKLPNIIRSTVAISISAQVFTLPILILYFNEVSINFLLGNILVMPFINILVILGNLLLICEKIPEIFNFILYLSNYVIKYIDIIMYKLENIGFDLIYLNYTLAYFYISLLITYYFYKKGFKRFLFLPCLMVIYIGVLIYSPFPTIRYYKEGALLISYKGDRVLVQTRDNIDEEKLKASSISDKLYSDVRKIIVGNNIIVEKEGKNFLLSIGQRQYLLFVNYEKINDEYDIIDFRKGDLEQVVLFNENITKNR